MIMGDHRRFPCLVRVDSRMVGHTGVTILKNKNWCPTPDMTDLRLFFALSVLVNKMVFGADVSNAFAEAEAPEQVYYMRVDTQYSTWYQSLGILPFLWVMLSLLTRT
jgi:hypothetical protein